MVAEPPVGGEVDRPLYPAGNLNSNFPGASALLSLQDASPLEATARPLLQLAKQISGMETTFVTSIDWDAQTQEILFSLNTAELELAERTIVGWQDSMCRGMFQAGLLSSSQVGVAVPASAMATALGIKSFFAVPVMLGEDIIGTVCGASQRVVDLSETQESGLRLIAAALQKLLEMETARLEAQSRALLAEACANQARMEAKRHAADSQRMQYLAHTDAMTGLPNRRAFIARWADELRRSELAQRRVGLIMIDADRFKAVNDGMGHEKGDAVLRAIAATLLVVKRPADVIARLGGDEFVLATAQGDAKQLIAVAEQIRRMFAVMAAELGVTTTLSMGMATSDDCHRSQMLAAADKALYLSKATGGNTLRSLPPGIEGFSHAA